RGRVIGTYNAIRLFSGALGSMLAGWLFVQFGFWAPNLLLILVTLASFNLLNRPRTDTAGSAPAPAGGYRILMHDLPLQALAAFRICYAFAVMMVRTFVPIYAGLVLGFNAFQVGVIIAAEQAVNMTFQRFGGSLSDRFGRMPLIAIGAGGYAVAAFFLPSQQAFAGLVAANALLGLTDALREPASMALYADRGKERGGISSAFAIREMLWRPGSILGPGLGGALMAARDITLVFQVGAGFAVLGLVSMGLRLGMQKYRRRRSLEPPNLGHGPQGNQDRRSHGQRSQADR
ncbi:MAG: MFS transporter, partial [Thermaerobacterales bacterium]